MQYIYNENENLINILGKQEYDKNANYRLNHYVIQEKVDAGILLFNNITKALILLKGTEAEEFYQFESNKTITNFIKTLIEKWFIVNENFNELKVTDQIKELYSTIKKYKQDTGQQAKSYTILTTTQCNARCFYCYEHGIEKQTMDEKTTNDVANYIIKNAEKSKDKKTHLAWFGGEPLLGEAQTDLICSKLADNGVEYESTMISNGYLFDDAMIKKAKDLWHLKQIQITLDGTQDYYNQIKRYIYKDDKNPFERVIQNIEKLVNNKIFTTIRLNLSPTNYKNIEELILYLSKRLKSIIGKKDKNGRIFLMVYTHTIFQELDKVYEEKIEINDKLRELYKWEFKFEELINKLGLASRNKLPRSVSLNYCMADSGNCEIILPDGKLAICEHFINGENSFSSIYTEKVDQKMLNSWKEKIPKQNICETCAYYPTCMRIKNCPNTHEVCYEEDKNYRLQKMHLQLQNDYLNYKSANRKKAK